MKTKEYKWLLKIIKSCRTLDHLTASEKLIKLFYDRTESATLADNLATVLFLQTMEIKKRNENKSLRTRYLDL